MIKKQKVLNVLKKGWAGFLRSSLVIIASVNIVYPAAFAQTAQQEMTYDVYAGGIHAVEADLSIDFSQNKRYSAELSAATRGLLRKLAPWDGSFETNGWYDVKTKKMQPEFHQSHASWKDEIEKREYHYSKQGDFKEYRVTDEYSGRELRAVPGELTKKTTDVLTATLAVMQKTVEANRCEGISEVFDGKRRFRMVFNHMGEEILKPSKLNAYNGPAVKCQVEVIPLLGKWHKKPRGWLSIQEQGRERGKMPTIWMAKLDKEGPAVPVRILVKTQFGALVMHLTSYKNDNDIILAKINND